MPKGPRKIKVTSGGELDRLLAEAADTPLLIEKDGELFSLARMEKDRDNIFAGYDPEKVIEAINATAGTLSKEEADALIVNLYKAREEGSRPSTRP